MNNSNICPIIISNPGNVSNKISDSIEHYTQETKNHILKYLPIAIVKARKSPDRKVKKIINYILNNEDLFNNIMTSIMMADFTHDKTKSSLKYWRSKNCLWTLNRTIYKNKIRPVSFGERTEDSDNEEVILNETPLDQVLAKEQFLIQAAKLEELSEREKLILSAYYDENLNEKEISERFDLCQQRISQILTSIKKKINYE